MDMTRYLKPYLNIPQLEAMGGHYEGVIDDVTSEWLRDRYKAKKSEEAVLSFVDGTRLVLNKTTLKKCLEWFGPESKDWIGRRITVFIRQVETVNRETGKVRIARHRDIACADIHARAEIRSRPAIVTAVEAPPAEPWGPETVTGSADYEARLDEIEEMLPSRRRA